jgi:hypothetical protein
VSKDEEKKSAEEQQRLCRHGFHVWREEESKDDKGQAKQVLRCRYCGKLKEE